MASTYRQDREAVEALAQTEKQAASDEKALYQFFQKHREVQICEANRNILLAYFNGESMSLASLEDAICNPTLAKQLAYTSEEKTKSSLIRQIMALYVGSDAAREAFAAKLKYDSIEALESELAEIESRREMQAKPVSELRTIANSRPTPERAELPDHMTREYLLSLNKPGEFKRIVERYGLEATTRRLNERGRGA
jgi:hypothetical protein